MANDTHIINGIFSMLPRLKGMAELPDGLAIYGSLSNPDDFDVSGFPKDKYVDTVIRSRFLFAFFCQKGEATIRLNLRDYTIRPGNILVAMPGTLLEHVENLLATRGAAIILSESVYHLLPQEYINTVKGLEMAPPFLFYPTAEQENLCSDALDLLQKLMQLPSGNHRDGAIQGCLHIVSNTLIDAPRLDEGTGHQDKAQQVHSAFLRDVAANYKRQREINFYASQQCLSPKYFGQIILKATGRNAADIIREYVIVEAKVMLRSQRYTVQQVADELHFSSQSAFGKYFKNATGMSPKSFQSNSN